MSLAHDSYEMQAREWPLNGQHILAHYDDATIIVYQAYCRSIGKFAIDHGQLGGPGFSFNRMTWIKPNFLWMMYRSGWGTKRDQETTLALRLRRTFFDELLDEAVSSSYDPGFNSREKWADAVHRSEVRLQWDPDHSPSGEKLARKALQLGLRGKILERFARSELLEIIDLSAFVESQRPNATLPAFGALRTPVERVYIPESRAKHNHRN